MPIINYNESWMLYNCFLAFLALGFGYFLLISVNKYLKWIFGILWLLFLPNTIYIFTDLVHLIDQWPLIHMPLTLFLLLEYIILEFVGIITFVFAFFPFEKLFIRRKKLRTENALLIILFNFFIAFGMVLGRVERINSWEVFTDPLKVFYSAFHVFTSWQLVGLMLLFGIFCNCIYFLLRNCALYITRTFSQVLD